MKNSILSKILLITNILLVILNSYLFVANVVVGLTHLVLGSYICGALYIVCALVQIALVVWIVLFGETDPEVLFKKKNKEIEESQE